jgi:hypothetical protein
MLLIHRAGPLVGTSCRPVLLGPPWDSWEKLPRRPRLHCNSGWQVSGQTPLQCQHLQRRLHFLHGHVVQWTMPIHRGSDTPTLPLGRHHRRLANARRKAPVGRRIGRNVRCLLTTSSSRRNAPASWPNCPKPAPRRRVTMRLPRHQRPIHPPRKRVGVGATRTARSASKAWPRRLVGVGKSKHPSRCDTTRKWPIVTCSGTAGSSRHTMIPPVSERHVRRMP